MHHVLKPLKTKLVLSGFVVLQIFAAAQEPVLATESTFRFTKPIDGPQLPAPISGPDANAGDPIVDDSPKTNPDYAYGAYQRGYYLTALEMALPRAEIGDPAAQTLIAELLWKGLGIARDRKKAANWYRFAAKGGGRAAQFHYGNLLLQGEFVELDLKLGEDYLRKAADAGHPRAQFNLAQIITSRRPTWSGFQSALPFYKAAAKAGIADAQYALANIYAEAKGVNFSDEEKARSWLKKSALGGLDTAQVEYGVWLANGRGGDSDKVQAQFWFTRAAVQGNVVAQNRLARIHAFADEEKVDLIQAGAWYIISRRAGFSDPELDRMFQALPEIDKKRAIEAANQLTKGLARIAKG
ncbi:MAG: sel1 repeat family protein [Rhizobiaceae bacterium]|nr:sel1 repeat family protein [Rhizobiaceae bacterium]